MGFGNFATWLIGFSKSFLAWLYNHVIDLLQGLIDGVAAFALVVIGLFPAGPSMPSGSPELPINSAMTAVVTAVNWLFPVAYCLQCITFITAGMVAYFLIAPLARWVKLLT